MAENFFKDLEISKEEWDRVKVANVGVRPNSKSAYGSGLTAEQVKELFDKGPELIKDRFNKLVKYAFDEENKRIAAEKERADNEDLRKKNETSRQQQFSEMQNAFGDLDKAIDAILTTQELIIGGGA